MKSRAELLAEIEEKRLENKNIEDFSIVDSKLVPDPAGGYDPYDNPGRRKQIRDVDEFVLRGRRAAARNRRP